MKIRRHKKVHKHINFYVNNFGFRQPFQVLIDGTFCLAALKNKVNIQDQLPKYLQAELKLLTTPCVVLETEELGPKVFGAMKIVKQFAVHKCGHEKSRDRELQAHLRNIPGVPVMYLHQIAPVLEQPSEESVKTAKSNIDSRFGVSQVQGTVLSKLKQQSGIAEDKDDKPKRKKKKTGPNPLSCLKKKKKGNASNITRSNNSNNNTNGVVKNQTEKRRRLRVPKHVKEELLKNVK
ncbi:uncharacterized protein CBL_02720 [Carabus blaptoides fortunei]